MRRPNATTLEGEDPAGVLEQAHAEPLALVVVWSESDPTRVGEALLVDQEAAWFGRAGEDSSERCVQLVRQRPGKNEPTAPLDNPFLSRKHLRLRAVDEETISVECLGKRPLLSGGSKLESLQVRPGDTFELRGLYGFVCVTRPRVLAPAVVAHDFGGADEHGVVGESAAAWELRRQLAFAAARNAHVLITGPSGTGKELVAKGIHAASARRQKPMISRNASTLPQSLIDAELFGNIANYPNVGMPERPGLVGQAHQSTLFLDEAGELSADLQAHLLRVLDSGEYQRLGDAKPRVVDLRLMAATNRLRSDLKHDFAARFALEVAVPGLGERIEDVPLLARHLVTSIAREDSHIGERYLRGWNGRTGEPRFSSELARALVLQDYTTHVREVQALLWRSMQTSSGAVLELTGEVRALLRERPAPRNVRDISAAELEAALARHRGVKDKVWRELGLTSRHALHRLMKRLVTGESAKKG